jgi:hypothetical protein
MGDYTASSSTHPYRQHQNWKQNQRQNCYQNLSQSLSPGLSPIRHHCRLRCLGNPDEPSPRDRELAVLRSRSSCFEGSYFC